MAQQVKLAKGSRLTLWASVCIVVAALYLAQEVLIPLALAILFTFLLGPLVARLERWRVPRVAAVLIVVVTAVALLVGLGWMVERQFIEVAQRLPSYTTEIRDKLTRAGHSMGWLGRAVANVERTFHDVMPASPVTSAAPQSGDAQPGAPALPQVTPQTPLPVRRYPAPGTPVGELVGYVGTALSPLATAGMVLVFVIFMLLRREDLRERLVRLAGGGRQHLTTTTTALDDAATRISRYLLMQLIVNATYGTAISLGLWIIGKFSAEGSFPSVLLWGLLCMVLRFIPYIGPWIAAVFPVALSFALFKSGGVFLSTLGLFVVIELWSNNMMEPWLYGTSTGMSTVAILVSAVFWTWLWGPVGLLLSTPLTVVLVVLGKHVPQLGFLDIMLGDEPVLDPPARLYQRLLARDEDEATEVAHQLLAEKGLDAVYDEVLVPALGLAERDRRRRVLDRDRHDFVRGAMRDIVLDLAEAARLEEIRRGADAAVALAKGESGAAGPAVGDKAVRAAAAADAAPAVGVVCLPAEDEDDELAALMLAQLLERRGYRALAVSQHKLASEMLHAVEEHNASVVCVSALPPAAVPHSRYLVKRLRPRFPDMPLVVGLWTDRGDLLEAKRRISPTGPTQIATTLADAIEQVRQVAAHVSATVTAARAG